MVWIERQRERDELDLDAYELRAVHRVTYEDLDSGWPLEVGSDGEGKALRG